MNSSHQTKQTTQYCKRPRFLFRVESSNNLLEVRSNEQAGYTHIAAPAVHIRMNGANRTGQLPGQTGEQPEIVNVGNAHRVHGLSGTNIQRSNGCARLMPYA